MSRFLWMRSGFLSRKDAGNSCSSPDSPGTVTMNCCLTGWGGLRGPARDSWNYPANHHQECPSEEGCTLLNSKDSIFIRWAAWALSAGWLLTSETPESSGMWLGIQIFHISAESFGCWACLWCELGLRSVMRNVGQEQAGGSQLTATKVQELPPTPLLHCRFFHTWGVCAVDVGMLRSCWWGLNIQNIPLMRQQAYEAWTSYFFYFSE